MVYSNLYTIWYFEKNLKEFCKCFGDSKTSADCLILVYFHNIVTKIWV